jgi:putative superfamily III holin-X
MRIGFERTSETEGKPSAMAHREPVTTPDEEPTIGKLVVDASRDVSDLIKHEIELAKSELKVSVRAGGISIGLFAAAGFLVLLAIIMLSVAIAYFIQMIFDIDLAWCFLIVFVGYVLVAGLLGFVGVRTIKKVRPPERAIEQGKQIPAAFKRGS